VVNCLRDPKSQHVTITGPLNIHLFMDRDNCKLSTSDEVERPRRCLRGGQDSTLPESSARREIFASMLLPILDNRSMRRFTQFELIAHLLQARSKRFNLLCYPASQDSKSCCADVAAAHFGRGLLHQIV
jgi:hypothetical protein